MSTQDIARAFAYGSNKSSGNHMATHDGERSHYYLHGNLIATWDRQQGTFHLTNAGYPSVTTAKAVNAILAQCGWVGATVKAWVLTDRAGRSSMFRTSGVTLYRHAQPDGFSWQLNPPDGYPSDLSPVLGG